MTFLEFVFLVAIAGVIGAIGQSIVGYSRGGCLAAIALGFIGALLGTWIARETGLPELLLISVGDRAFPIVWSIIGASLFVALISMLSSRRRREPA